MLGIWVSGFVVVRLWGTGDLPWRTLCIVDRDMRSLSKETRWFGVSFPSEPSETVARGNVTFGLLLLLLLFAFHAGLEAKESRSLA